MTMKARIKSFIVLDGWLRNWVTSLLMHRSQLDEHEWVDFFTNVSVRQVLRRGTRRRDRGISSLLFLESAGTAAKHVLPTPPGLGD